MTPAQQTRFRVQGMDCAGCAAKIDTALRRMPGVTDVAVSVTAGTLTLHHNASTDLGVIRKKVTGLGYEVSPMTAPAPIPTTAAGEGLHSHNQTIPWRIIIAESHTSA